MAKLKKAFGRQIARWKQDAIAANTGASDEDLAKVINETAKAQGLKYTITPDKVRTKGKKKRRKRRHVAPADSTTPAAAPKQALNPAATAGISVSDIEAVKGLVERLGAGGVQELAGVLSERGS
jgi:hypothetical protein